MTLSAGSDWRTMRRMPGPSNSLALVNPVHAVIFNKSTDSREAMTNLFRIIPHISYVEADVTNHHLMILCKKNRLSGAVSHPGDPIERNVDLLQHDHFTGCSLILGFELVEVHTASKIRSIKDHFMMTCNLLIVHKHLHLPSQQIVDR